MKLQLDKSIIFRFLITIVLLAGAIGLYLGIQSHLPESSQQSGKEISATVIKIDQEVDSVLAQFRIEKDWSRKRQIIIPGTNLHRIERRVLIPPEVIPVQMNRAFNLMAKRYDGRAIGSENIKENTVTIHIKLEGRIIETVILKTSRDIKIGGIINGRKKI